MLSLNEWLELHGLERYADVFARNDVDQQILGSLSDEDLRELGLTLGHRRRLQQAIAKDKQQSSVPLVDAARDSAAVPPASPGERRQLTVMFCDLVGSTALAQKIDAEPLRDLMRNYQRLCTQVVQKYGGHVAQYLGDGLMVYFGWPQAHEDDAERSVRVALEIVEAVKSMESPEQLAVRVGIATGAVVVGETGNGDASVPKMAVGETPNLAARLQSLAPADGIVIAASTYRLLGGAFEYGDLGSQALKGIVEPVHAWQVLGASKTEGRFEARHGATLTPLVGRDEELGLLKRRWAQAAAGEGHVVLLGGEPGIGKSRIARAMREHLEQEPHIHIRYQCSPFHVQSALFPVIDQFERAAGFQREDDAQRKLAKMEALVGGAMSQEGLGAVLPLFAAMLSLPPDRYAPLTLTPQKHKEKTLEALVDQVRFLSQREPVLMVFEDLHWVDPTTEEVLDLLIRNVARLPVLLIMTHRPEYVPRWIGEPHVTSINLSRLARRFGSQMANNVTGGVSLPANVLEEILAKTDGVPLFVEELTKAVLESGMLRLGAQGYEMAGPMDVLAIPSTLRDSLMSRLDRLSEVREVAQIGAVIGREFSHELILAVSQLREPTLRLALDQLAAADLISRRGAPPQATYSFKHALIQDAAYTSLLNSRRQILHLTIADTLVSQFSERASNEPEMVARHYDAAAAYGKAVECWVQAGNRAIEHFANTEAVEHFLSGLKSLGNLPEGIDKDRRELLLQSGLGTALGTSKGYTPPEVGRAFERARELSDRVADAPNKFLILFGLWVYYLMRADYTSAWKLAYQILELSEHANQPGAAVLAHGCISCNAMFTGEFEQALRHGMIGVEIYRKLGSPSLGFLYGFDSGILCYEWTSWILLFMGYADQANSLYAEGIHTAESHGHPLTVATTRVHFTGFHNLREDPKTTLACARRAVAYATENGILLRTVEAQIMEGWALAQTGETDAGIAEIESALATWRQLGARIWDSGWYGDLARAYLCGNRIDDARNALTQAFHAGNSHGEHAYTAELHRIDGELRSLEGKPIKEIEACFQEGIRLAIDQKAKRWELRSTTALARLWKTQGKTTEAHALLGPVYAWFTEGFDTKDLKEAKVLLEELSK